MDLTHRIRETLRKEGPLTRPQLLARVSRYISPSRAGQQYRTAHKQNNPLPMAGQVESGRKTVLNRILHMTIKRGQVSRDGEYLVFVRHPESKKTGEGLTLSNRLREAINQSTSCTLNDLVVACEQYVSDRVALNRGNQAARPAKDRKGKIAAGKRRAVYRTLHKMVKRGQITKEGNYYKPGRPAQR